MAQHSDQPPVPPAPAHAHFDEKSGIYGFFRRHQKKILYTVVLFTLLTFSVGGPMLQAVSNLFKVERPMPTIEVGGRRVPMTEEDGDYGQAIARFYGALYTVLPGIDAGEGGHNELGTVLALLRRAAIELGLDVSMTEVDRALAALREKSKLASDAQLASQRNFQSLAQYRDLMKEAMRIGQLVRLETLLLDNSDAAVLQQVIADKEKITLQVATFDEKALEEALTKAGGLTDDGLKKWLDGKPETDKHRIGVFDTNRVELQIGAALLSGFDAAQWQDSALKDWKAADDQLKKTYEQEKETRFKLEDGKGFKPADDEAVKAEVLKLLQLDQVMNHVLGQLREKLNESMQDVNKEMQSANEAWGNRQAVVNTATQAVATAKQKLAEKPDDPALQEALARAESDLHQEKEALTALENNRKAAEEALKQKRAAFDFGAAFTELTKDKQGFVLKAFAGKRNAEALKDLEAGDLGLGQWPLSIYATYLQNQGDLGNMPGRTSKAVILYQVKDVEVRPLKPWDQLKPLLEGAYYTEKAKTEAEAKKKTMEEALLRLAKAKIPDKVAELEGKRAGTVDEKLANWVKDTEADLAKAEKVLAGEAQEGTQAHAAWTRRRDMLKEQLAKKDERRKTIDEEVGKQIEHDVGEAAKGRHAEVLAEAAAAAGFTVAEFGPHPRELSMKPRFDQAYDHTVVFLFQNHAQMKAGESTGVVQDVTNRRWHVACCTKVEPLTVADVDRREFELLRKGYGFSSYARLRAQMAFGQAWTREALEKRYAYKPALGEQRVDEPKKEGGK